MWVDYRDWEVVALEGREARSERVKPAERIG